MEDFLRVKQDSVLYEHCVAAREARVQGQYVKCLDEVRTSFARMAEVLMGTEGEGKELLQRLTEQGLLTDRSLAAYREMLTETDGEMDGLRAENAYASLEEEIDKYTKFYQKGESPKSIEEISSSYSDGIHSTRDHRNHWDAVFYSILIIGFIVVGVGLLILSAVVPSMSNWMLGGILFALTGILFGYMNMKVKK